VPSEADDASHSQRSSLSQLFYDRTRFSGFKKLPPLKNCAEGHDACTIISDSTHAPNSASVRKLGEAMTFLMT
jgi:hypothetical protein